MVISYHHDKQIITSISNASACLSKMVLISNGSACLSKMVLISNGSACLSKMVLFEVNLMEGKCHSKQNRLVSIFSVESD